MAIGKLIIKIKLSLFDCFLGDDGKLKKCIDYPDWLWWIDSLFEEKSSGSKPKRPSYESLIGKSPD